MSDEDLDESALASVPYLIIETLAARYRTGEHVWTFPSRFRTALRDLESAGWIGWKSGIVERTCLAWFTERGLAAAISADYTPPLDRLRAGLAVRDEALAEIAALHKAVLCTLCNYSEPHSRCNQCGDEAPCDTQRILANLSLDPYRDDKEQLPAVPQDKGSNDDE